MRRLLKQKCTCRCNLCSVNRTNEMATIISYRTFWDHFLYFYCIQQFGSGWKLLLRSLYLTCGAFCDHKMKPFDFFFFVITWHIIESCSSHYPPCLQGPLIGLIRVLGGDYKSLPRHDMREERREKRKAGKEIFALFYSISEPKITHLQWTPTSCRTLPTSRLCQCLSTCKSPVW